MKKKLNQYMQLQYQVIIRPINEKDGGGWLAEIPELKGCFTDGETQEEALYNLNEAKLAWFKTAIKRGQKIPIPNVEDNLESYSGKFTLRIPKSMHKELAMSAKNENMSLNQYILSLLSFNFGRELHKSQSDKSQFLNQVIVYSTPQEGVLTGLKNRYSLNPLAANPLSERQIHPDLWSNQENKQEALKWQR